MQKGEKGKMKIAKRIAAFALATAMAVTFVPVLPGVTGDISAADGGSEVEGTEKASASTVTAESPSEFTYETDFDALTQKWRRYARIAFGLDKKEWLVCGRQGDELVMFCNPADSYGSIEFGGEATSYETSQLDKTLQEMTGNKSTAFSESEISLMKDVSVALIGDYSNSSGSKYEISRKLYAPYPNDTSINMGKAVNNEMGDISLSMNDSQLKDASFWGRAVNNANVYRYENGKMKVSYKSDCSNLAPVMHLDLSSDTAKPIFVSAAEPAKADAAIASDAKNPTPENTTLCLRYDGGQKVSYQAEYNSGSITVSSSKAAHDEYLYVQWSENNVNKVKSIRLEDRPTAWGGESRYTAEEIGGSGFTFNGNMKIWVEKNVDNLVYARMAAGTKEEGPEVPADLKMTRATNGESNGAISGLDAGEEYEYCLYSSTKAAQEWIKLPKGSTEIKNLCSGNYHIRTVETEKRTAGPERTYRVKDIYDVTVDSDTKAVKVNEKDISEYSVFGSLSIDLSYSKENVFNTLSRIKDVFDAGTVSSLIDKYVSGQNKEEFNTHKTVEGLGQISKRLSAISAKTDGSTKEILGDIDSTELKREWNEAKNSFSQFQESYYDDFTAGRYGDIKEFYSGGIVDKDKTADIDSSLLYFYSDGNKSQLTGKMDEMANGTKLYSDFTAFGDTLLNAAVKGKDRKDFFALCDGVYSYLHNFNNETFSERDEMYRKIFCFYEKGYSALASSLAYNISNHKDQLNRITDLRTAAVNAETSEESETIQDAIKTVAKETAKVYGLDTGSFGWSELEKLHEEQIEKEKEYLKNLNAQYEAVKTAYAKAEKILQAEKEKYETERIITCYRNKVKYNADMEILSVNDPYLEAVKSTDVEDFLVYRWDNIGISRYYIFKDVTPAFAAPDRSSDKAAEQANDLESFTEWAKERGMSFNDQIGKAFNFWDTDTQKSVQFSRFSSDDKYSDTIGFYVNGEQKLELEEHTIKAPYGHFYRNVSYYKDGATRVFCSVHKAWHSLVPTTSKTDMIANDVKSDKYVIHLNRVIETPGRGGGDGCFMAKGTAKSATNKITWNEVEGADGYDVYYARCGKTMKKVKSTTALKYTKRNLSKKRSYKYRIKAYTNEGGTKEYIARSPVIHVAGVDSGYSNATKVTVKSSEIQMKEGETAALKAEITKKSSRKPVMWKKHVKSKIRYTSSDGSVAAVNSKGRVTATGEGTTNVYVYAANGAFAKVTVTVEAEPDGE